MTELNKYLDRHRPLKNIVLDLSNGAKEVSKLIANNHELANATGGENIGGDSQKALDVLADDIFLEKCKKNGQIYQYLSEEKDDTVILDKKALYSLAIDPLDGSSNIDTNISIGTIISIFDSKESIPTGREQVAALFFVYGPSTTLIITCLDGLHLFKLADGEFILIKENIKIPIIYKEYAINVSNINHWDKNIKEYIIKCNENYNMDSFSCR